MYMCTATYFDFIFVLLLIASWWRGTVVERRSLAGELSLSCANVGKPSAIGQPTNPTQPVILSGSINE